MVNWERTNIQVIMPPHEDNTEEQQGLSPVLLCEIKPQLFVLGGKSHLPIPS